MEHAKNVVVKQSWIKAKPEIVGGHDVALTVTYVVDLEPLLVQVKNDAVLATNIVKYALSYAVYSIASAQQSTNTKMAIDNGYELPYGNTENSANAYCDRLVKMVTLDDCLGFLNINAARTRKAGGNAPKVSWGDFCTWFNTYVLLHVPQAKQFNYELMLNTKPVGKKGHEHGFGNLNRVKMREIIGGYAALCADEDGIELTPMMLDFIAPLAAELDEDMY